MTRLIRALERPVELVVALDQLVAYASTQALAGDVARRCAASGVRSARAGRLLGVDFASGRAVGGLVREARLRRVATRSRRFGGVRRTWGAGAKFFKAADEAAIAYAAAVTGMPDRQPRAARIAAGRATQTRAAGHTLEIDSALAGSKLYDPAYRANAALLCRWATAVWSGELEPLLRTAGRRACATPRGHRWRQVRGPASAMAATCDRIGWRWGGHAEFVDHRGRVSDASVTCPVTLKAVIHEATQRWIWRTLAERLPAFS